MTLVIPAAGCASRESSSHKHGPARTTVVRQEPWEYQGEQGLKLTTTNYTIYTTIEPDDALIDALPQVLEGALGIYRTLAPAASVSDRPMECYIFGGRSQWANFTRNNTGPVAGIYLQITRGGYTIGDRFVAYDLGDHTTAAVTAHEGWHQFSARHFKSRLPPFLEEGISCIFENVQWEGRLPTWDLRTNPRRALALRKSFDRQRLFPLAELIESHAGQVVRSSDRIDAFYAQCWAFARFMMSAENGRFKPAFDRLLADAVNGRIKTSHGDATASGWDADMSRPIIEHYFQMPLEDVERRFLEYGRWVAYREFRMHWDD